MAHSSAEEPKYGGLEFSSYVRSEKRDAGLQPSIRWQRAIYSPYMYYLHDRRRAGAWLWDRKTVPSEGQYYTM